MKFPTCGDKPIGLYPVVDRASKLEASFLVGVTTGQLRIKDLDGNHLDREILEAIDISRKLNTRLFINDHWEHAIKYKAYGVHLGQSDIKNADIKAILDAGLRLGISTHTTDEINVALDFEPSYIAIGPVFRTNSKKMPYDPVGIEELSKWSQKVSCPVVAIGGINIKNIDRVLQVESVDGVAMIQGVENQGYISKHKLIELLRKFDVR